MLAEGDREYESNSDVEDDEEEETPEKPGKNHKDIFVHVTDLQDELRARIYTDQTGKFPVRSSKGNQYLMIMFKMDSDLIPMEPIRDRPAGEMTKTYQKMVNRLKECGIYPKHQVLDKKFEKRTKQPLSPTT